MSLTEQLAALLSESFGQPFAEPLSSALIALSAVIYCIGTHRLWSRAGTGRGVRPWEAWAFACGLFALLITVSPPVGWLADVLFSAHMGQHESLMLLCAPLLVLGQPGFVMLWALPSHQRESIGRWTRRAYVARTWRAITAPACVFALHAAVLWMWHVPALFNAALANHTVHVGQHVSFVLASALFWWGMVHGRYGRIGYGVAVLYVFLTAVHSNVLGALITVAPTVWYAPYLRSGEPWGIDPLGDQQLAGLIMWIPATLIFLAFGLSLLAAWLGESERRVRLGSVQSRSANLHPLPRTLSNGGK